MKTIIGKDILIYDFNKDIIDYCEKNLTLENPEYFKKEKMGFYLGNTPKKIYLFTLGGNYIRLPFGELMNVWKIINKHPFELDFSKNHKISLSVKDNFNYYDYQIEAIDALIKNKGGVLEAPCGAGKTIIGLSLIAKLGLKALWITHTKRLLKQAIQDAKDLFTHIDYGEITEGKISIGKDITFSTIQTLSKCDLEAIREEFNVVVVDECHHIAGSPTHLTMYYSVLSRINARYKYGLSATLSRSDGLIRSTFSLIGNISYSVEEVKKLKAKLEVIRTPFNFYNEIDNFTKGDGTFDLNSYLNFLSVYQERNEFLVNIIANKMQNRNKCLILSLRVEHCKQIYSLLKEKGLDVIYLSAKEKIKENDFKHKYIVATSQLAREGLDEKELDTLFLVAPIKDKPSLIQAIGRIERYKENKLTPSVIYFEDAFYYGIGIGKKIFNILK